MPAILHLLGTLVANVFGSRRRLEVENLFLRYQLNIALRRGPQRLRLSGSDRAMLGLDDVASAKPARLVPCRSAGHDPALSRRRPEVNGLVDLSDAPAALARAAHAPERGGGGRLRTQTAPCSSVRKPIKG